MVTWSQAISILRLHDLVWTIRFYFLHFHLGILLRFIVTQYQNDWKQTMIWWWYSDIMMKFQNSGNDEKKMVTKMQKERYEDSCVFVFNLPPLLWTRPVAVQTASTVVNRGIHSRTIIFKAQVTRRDVELFWDFHCLNIEQGITKLCITDSVVLYIVCIIYLLSET